MTVDQAKLTLTCPTGNFDSLAKAKSDGAQILNYGIINDGTEVKSYCSYEKYNDPMNCKQYIDGDKLKNDLYAFDDTNEIILDGFSGTKYRNYWT